MKLIPIKNIRCSQCGASFPVEDLIIEGDDHYCPNCYHHPRKGKRRLTLVKRVKEESYH